MPRPDVTEYVTQVFPTSSVPLFSTENGTSTPLPGCASVIGASGPIPRSGSAATATAGREASPVSAAAASTPTRVRDGRRPGRG